MAEGFLTEREWRQGCKLAVPAACWGAQYVRASAPVNWKSNRKLRALMLLFSFLVAVLMPLCFGHPRQRVNYPMAVIPAAAGPMKVRNVSSIRFSVPEGLRWVNMTCERRELLQGKLMLVDHGHPLPEAALVENDLQTIATYGKGMVPVGDLSLQSGGETIDALAKLFAALRMEGADGFRIWKGTQSPQQYWQERMALMRSQAANVSLEEAARFIRRMGSPMAEAYLLEDTVEIRHLSATAHQPDERLPEETSQGRKLLKLAWRNGFIRTHPKEDGFCFRYVGIAHATAMTYLDVDLPTYLAILHERRHLTLEAENGVTYLIQCIPAAGEYVAFQVPEGAVCEASLDNTGYAVVVCRLPA